MARALKRRLDETRLNVRIDYRTPTVTSIGGRDDSVRSGDGLFDLGNLFVDTERK